MGGIGARALGVVSCSLISGACLTIFDFGEWKSEVASERYPDGSLSFSTISPGSED